MINVKKKAQSIFETLKHDFLSLIDSLDRKKKFLQVLKSQKSVFFYLLSLRLSEVSTINSLRNGEGKKVL